MRLIVALLVTSLSIATAQAADPGAGSNPAPSTPAAKPTPTPTPTPSISTTPVSSAASKSLTSELTMIRALIAAKNYKSALTELRRVDKIYQNNADINNLLGYSSRNLKQYKQAATYYVKALKIDPNHLGALEYQGELFMLTKKTSDAKKNLAKLKSLCGVNCEEYIDLKKAIGNE
jgi:tetratricopeptide (TPR) repeat protein